MPFFVSLRRAALALCALCASLTVSAQLVPFPPAPMVKLAVNPVTNKVYALNESSNSVTVLDAATGATATVPVGPRPQYIAVNPATNRVYVNNAGDSTISIIDGATDTNLTPTPLLVGSHGPISVNPVTNIVYIVRLTGPGSDEVTFFNANDNTWYSIATESFQPIAMAVNPVTNTIYVVHYATGDVRIIGGGYDGEGFPPTQSIGLWSKPVAVAVNPVTNRIYAITEDARGPIFIINGATREAVYPLPAAGHARSPKALAVNPVTNRIYAAFDGEVIVIDGATNAYTYVPVATGSGAVGLAVNTATNKIYVASAGGVLTTIDGATNAASVQGIPAGANALGVNPVTNTAYVFGDAITALPGSGSAVANGLTTSISPLAGDTSGPDATFTFTAANGVSPLPVRRVYWQLDGAGPWAAASGSGPWSATLAGLASGSHTLRAFAAEGEDAPLHSGAQSPLVGTIAAYTFTVSGGSAAVSLAASPNPSTAAQAVTFTASVTASGQAPTGTVEFRDGSATIAGCGAVALAGGSAACVTSALTAGSHSITARYSGDSRYAAVTSSAITQVVNAARVAPTVALASSANPSTTGSAVTFTANVTGSAGVATGSVSFTDGGATLPGCAAVALASGRASCQATSLSAGNHAIVASYGGDGAYNAGSASLTQAVNAPAPAQATVTLASSRNPSTAGKQVTFTATASGGSGAPTGTVSFSSDGAAIAGCQAVALAAGSAACDTSALAVGSHAIVAQYSGNATYAPAASPTLTQTVQADTPAGNPQVRLSATSLAFGDQSMGTTSPARAVTLTNTGSGTLVIGSISVPAQFTQSNDCGSLAAGASCTLQLRFAPAAAPGPVNSTVDVSGTVSVASNSASSPDTMQVSGTAEKSLVVHFYQSILGRDADASGSDFWAAEAARMAGLGANVNETWYAMANFFYYSPEYLALGTTDAEFVADLYLTFFNRPPDQSGLDFWSARLAGGMPREVVLVAFMFSPEFASFTQGIFGNTAARAEVDMVMDFYRGGLARLPDDAGFQNYVGVLREAQCSGSAAVYERVEAISASFFGSPEYSQRRRSNGQFVGDLYNTFLRRGGEADGVSYWITQLNDGARTRDQVRAQFIGSSEFRQRVDRIVAQGCMR
jgi:YVTN family beta-propeller protein